MGGIDLLYDENNQYLFECFSNAVGLYLKAVSLEGDTILRFGHGRECDFCRQIQSVQYEKCRASYRMAAGEAAKWKEPYFFRCHAGLVMWAIALNDQGQCFGSMICGQILLWPVDHVFKEELRELNPEVEDFEALCENAGKLNIISAKKAQAVTETLNAIVNQVLNSGSGTVRQDVKEWRNIVLNHLENRKKKVLSDPLDAYRYMINENRLLQLIRLGKRDEAELLLSSLLSDMYLLSGYNLERVRVRAIELMTMVSRAVCEAGLDNHLVLIKNEQLYRQFGKADSFEMILVQITDMAREYLDDIDLLRDTGHRSVMRKVRSYIGAHYRQPLTIQTIAREVGFSQSYLSSLFRDNWGCTVNEYITKIRIENAVALMRQPELTIGEIAALCGFQSASYFTKVFKRQMGVTPVQYRNEFSD